MIIIGGIGSSVWTVTSIDDRAKNGRVLRRQVTIQLATNEPVTLQAQDALTLATAIRLTAKGGT